MGKIKWMDDDVLENSKNIFFILGISEQNQYPSSSVAKNKKKYFRRFSHRRRPFYHFILGFYILSSQKSARMLEGRQILCSVAKIM
jgi:hypothetical protein